MSLSGLASKFEIDLKATRRLICKMIYERQIQGSLTHEGYLNFVQKKQSEMQKICEQVSSKLNDMMTANEQLFNLRVHAHNED